MRSAAGCRWSSACRAATRRTPLGWPKLLGPPVLKAWRAVFPPATAMFAVGGIGIHNLAAFKQAGAAGVGTGSSLYSPGSAPAEITPRARAPVERWAAS